MKYGAYENVHFYAQLQLICRSFDDDIVIGSGVGVVAPHSNGMYANEESNAMDYSLF